MYFGPYRVLNTISGGQTTQVHEVIRDAENQRYALKTMIPELVTRQNTALLRHELDVGLLLKHPRVIRTFEYGSHKNVPYLVLELYRVPNLKSRIVAGYESLVPLAGKIIEQSAESLAFLAEQGWVHRDVKPDNFLVSDEGEVKLIDLALAQKPRTGLARLFSGRGKAQGTPSYMSPEQIRNHPLDAKADVYSFGCTVYQLACGKPPYTGVNTNELLGKHIRSPVPSLEAQNNNVTPEFANLVRRMLAKNAEDRPSMDDFLLEFRSIKLFKDATRTQGT